MLKLFPKPAGYATVLTAIADIDVAVELLNRLQEATGGLVTAFELMQRRALDLVFKHIPGTVDPFPGHSGWTVLIEVSNPSAFDATEALEQALARAMEEGNVVDAVFAKTARDRDLSGACAKPSPKRNGWMAPPSPTIFRCRCPGFPNSSGRPREPCGTCCPRRGPSPSAMSATAICISPFRRRAMTRPSRRTRRDRTRRPGRNREISRLDFRRARAGPRQERGDRPLQERRRDRADARAQAHARSQQHPQSGEAAASGPVYIVVTAATLPILAECQERGAPWRGGKIFGFWRA